MPEDPLAPFQPNLSPAKQPPLPTGPPPTGDPLKPFEPTIGGKEAPPLPKAPETKKQKKADIAKQNAQSMGKEVAKAMQPQLDAANALPSEYQDAMKGPEAAMKAEHSTGNATLDKDIAAENAQAMSGDTQMQADFAAIGKAGEDYAKALPYADVLTTSLNQRKNILAGYGTAGPKVDTSHWSDPLKAVYKYIEGTGAGSAVTGGPAGGPTLPGPQKGAYGAGASPDVVPSATSSTGGPPGT